MNRLPLFPFISSSNKAEKKQSVSKGAEKSSKKVDCLHFIFKCMLSRSMSHKSKEFKASCDIQPSIQMILSHRQYFVLLSQICISDFGVVSFLFENYRRLPF